MSKIWLLFLTDQTIIERLLHGFYDVMVVGSGVDDGYSNDDTKMKPT